MEYQTKKELVEHIICCINDYEGCEVSELHHHLFNTDYYIVGYYQSEEWLKENGGVFNNIQMIKEYEQDNFGEVNTDLSSSENVVNMLVYIIGEELLSKSETLRNVWDNHLTEENCKDIIKELEEV